MHIFILYTFTKSADLDDLLVHYSGFYCQVSAVFVFCDLDIMGDTLVCMVLKESLWNINHGVSRGTHVLSYLLIPITVASIAPTPDLPMLGQVDVEVGGAAEDGHQVGHLAYVVDPLGQA